MAAERPRCKACKKPLRKRTYSEEIASGAPDPTEWNGRKVVAVVFRKVLTYRPLKDGEKPPVRVSLWLGEWGGYGDGRFCGINCGYDWAVVHAPRT